MNRRCAVLDRTTVATICCGVLLLAAGCATTENGRAKGDGAVPPEPGTRAYYDQKIRGVYALDGGELVPMLVTPPVSSAAMSPDPSSGLTPARPRTLPRIVWRGAQTIEGRVLQVLSNNVVVCGTPVTNVSGAVAFHRSHLVSMAGYRQAPATGTWFRVLAMSSSRYTYQDGSRSGTLPAYREVTEPTYEEYRRIFERDRQAAIIEPIVSVTRVPDTEPQVPPAAPAVAGPAASAVPPGLPVRRVVRPPLRTPTALTLGDYTYATNAAGQATITGFNRDYVGTLALTNDLGGCPVTTVGDNAFLNCTKLTGVTIPGGVTQIAESAFRNCAALESILVDVLNPVYSSSADGVLFNTEKTRLLRYPPGRAGAYAVPRRTTEIGSCAFADCGRLTGLTLHDGVTSFAWGAASGCTNLAEVVLGEGVVHIGNSAFANCSSLRRIRLPASASDVVWNLFWGCDRLEAIEIAEANPNFRGDADGVVFSKDGTQLLRYPSGRAGAYVVPASVSRVGACAFEGSTGVTGVTLPAGLEAVEDYTFKLCRNLTRIVIPNSVTRIGGQVFSHCSSLSDIALPDKLTQLGGFTFWDCTNLVKLAIPGSLARIEGSTFQGCRGLANVTLGNGIASIGSHAFAWCGLTNIVIPASVAKIESCAFRGCTALTDVRFEGDAPSSAADTSVFCDGGNNATVYCRPGAKGWGETFGGRPVKVWGPPENEDTVTGTASGEAGDKGNLPMFSPRIQFLGTENYTTSAGAFVRYRIAVTNWADYPDDLFKPSPHLPPCGLNTNASRTWVDMYADGQCVYGFAALRKARDLTRLWFAGRPDASAPSVVHVVLNDRQTKQTYESNKLSISGATAFERAGVSETPNQQSPGTQLRVGDPAPALQQGKYVQGEPVAVFERGKVYVVEFWATWCGPCRTAIPHLNQLHDKFKDRGLIVIGQNVWERGTNVEAAVTKFVEGMGSNMTYRVALDHVEGTTGAMAETWMRAAGLRGIPSAFVVNQAGIIAWMGHPMSVDGVVEQVMAGTFDIEKEKQDRARRTSEMAAPQPQVTKGAEVVNSRNVVSGNVVGYEGNYIFDISEGVATIKGFSKNPFGTLSITNVLSGFPVTSIGDAAFQSCTDLTNITIPKSVTNIGVNAFGVGSNLTSVFFHGDAPCLASGLFDGSNKVTIYYRPGTAGWNKEFGGRPTAVWNPKVEDRVGGELF